MALFIVWFDRFSTHFADFRILHACVPFPIIYLLVPFYFPLFCAWCCKLVACTRAAFFIVRSHMSSLLHWLQFNSSICLVACLFGNCRSALKMPANGCVRWWAPSLLFARAFTVDLTHHSTVIELELELELIQTQMTQKPMLRAEVGMLVRCANN